jgi:alpha-beta hydrolase superfamily lysophospholipase
MVQIMRSLFIALAFVSPFAVVLLSNPGIAQEVEITTADDVRIFADVHLVEAGKKAPVILLFHQAGANARAEYATHIPRLLEAGYNIIAADQRSGGNRMGGTNRTIAKRDGESSPYCEAYPDLETALQYAVDNGFTGPRFAWGSSYSAALVVRLGVEHGDKLDGVLAFSPASGSPMGECQPNELFTKLDIPALILRPGREAEIDAVKDQLAIAREANLQVYVADNGVHGSSMLNKDRVKGDVEQHWETVLKFLADVTEQHASQE